MGELITTQVFNTSFRQWLKLSAEQVDGGGGLSDVSLALCKKEKNPDYYCKAAEVKKELADNNLNYPDTQEWSEWFVESAYVVNVGQKFRDGMYRREHGLPLAVPQEKKAIPQEAAPKDVSAPVPKADAPAPNQPAKKPDAGMPASKATAKVDKNGGTQVEIKLLSFSPTSGSGAVTIIAQFSHPIKNFSVSGDCLSTNDRPNIDDNDPKKLKIWLDLSEKKDDHVCAITISANGQKFKRKFTVAGE